MCSDLTGAKLRAGGSAIEESRHQRRLLSPRHMPEKHEVIDKVRTRRMSRSLAAYVLMRASHCSLSEDEYMRVEDERKTRKASL